MSKKIIKPLVTIVIALLIFVLGFYLGTYFQMKRVLSDASLVFKRNPNVTMTASGTPMEIMTDNEKAHLGLASRAIFQIISRDSEGQIMEYKMVGFREPQPLKLDIMTDQEKADRNLATSTKIQVLERDSAGKAISYKIIKKDSDIITKY